MTRIPLTRRTFLQGVAAAALASRAATPARAAVPARQTLRILTCNIRVPLEQDDASGHSWAARRDLCAEVMRRREPDLICLQEVLRQPLADLRERLPGFDAFGFEGPEMDAHPTGYHGIAKNVILYLRERYEPTSAGGFWLSETPHLPGTLSWHSARARHVNWVRFKSRVTGREFRVLATHLDHRSQLAREQQMRLIVEESALYATDFPQLLAGDFNADASNPVLRQTVEAGWSDLYAAVRGPAEASFTAHAFLGEEYATRAPKDRLTGRIDFILGRGPLKALSGEIIRDRRGTLYPSDHFFLGAEVAFT